MPCFPPELLAAWTGGRWSAAPAAPPTGFHFDTRRLRPGDVFVALKTDRRDGHAFLADARRAGAAGALVAAADPAVDLPQLVVADPLEAFQAIAGAHRRGFGGPVVGISGSAGKTSTKDLLALLLGGAPSGVVATEGNLNNLLGVPLTLTRLDPARTTCAVIEAGINRPGEMAVLARMIEPDVAVITLVAAAHTEELGGIDGVAREKAILPAATRPGGVAVFPRSVAGHAPFSALPVPAVVVERTDVLLPEASPGLVVHYAVSHRDGRTGVSVAAGSSAPAMFSFPRGSDGMAQNAVLAISVARRLGVADDAIRSRLADWQPGKLRGEIRQVDGRMYYVDCYNANPASMADALDAFAAVAPADQPRLFILGGMEELGDGSAAHHRALGRSLPLRDGDRLMVIGPQAHEVCAGVLERGDFSRQLQIVSSLDPVAETLAGWRGAVFLKGSRRYRLETVLAEQPATLPPC